MASASGAAGSTQTAAQLTTEIKTYYLMTLLERALPQLYHCNFAQRATIPKGGGNTVEWRKFSALSVATTALTEGVTPASQGSTVTTLSAIPLQYGSFIRYSDILELTAIDDVVEEYVVMLGEQAGDTADQLARALFVASGTAQIVGQALRTSLTAANTMSAAQLAKAWATLAAANARPFDEVDGKYPAIIHPHVWHDLFQDAEFRNAVQQAKPRSEDHPLFTGEVWDYMGIRFFVSSNAYIETDGGLGTVDAYLTLIIGRNAFGIAGIGAQDFRMELGAGGTGSPPKPVDLIFKGLGSEGSGDPLDQRATIAWKAIQEEKELDATWCVRIESASSIGSN